MGFWTNLHDALAGHFELDWQMSAQRDGRVDPGVSRQHSGVAVVPAGTPLGHGLDTQDGEQKWPFTPWTKTASSPA